jgi:hypothetical protein
MLNQKINTNPSIIYESIFNIQINVNSSIIHDQTFNVQLAIATLKNKITIQNNVQTI